tara:strand:- start:3179 stop:4372 length:1194 start_codon:yes stop_codon:yes gene_type:complete
MIRCEETLRKLIQQMRGQYFIYHNCETSNLPSWKIRWKSEYLPDKKFYVISSGNDGDYNDELLIDIDEIYDFFEERSVEKKKIIFLTSNNDLNHGLKTLTETIKTEGARKIALDKWDNLITDIKTEKIESEIPYCPYIFNVGDHPLDYNDLVEWSNKNIEPSKLFTVTMWTHKVPYSILFKKILESGLIKEMSIFDDEDKGWVSYANGQLDGGDLINRRFEKDTGESKWETNCYDILREKINDSYINLVAESNIDFTISEEEKGKWFLNKTGQYYRSIMTSSYLTEKTMWPIFLKKPFFIFGGYGSLDALKNYGFKTFDKIFDESYQYETDIIKKSAMIVNQLLELSTMSKYKVQNMIESVQDILEHNQKLLVSNAKDRASLIPLYVHGNIEDILNE